MAFQCLPPYTHSCTHGSVWGEPSAVQLVLWPEAAIEDTVAFQCLPPYTHSCVTLHKVQCEGNQVLFSRSIDLNQPLKTPWHFSFFLLIHTAVHMVQCEANQIPFSRSTDLKQPLKTPWDFSVFLLIHTSVHMVQCEGNQVLFSRSTDLKQPLKTQWHFNVFLLIHTAIQLYTWLSVRWTKHRSVGLLTWSSHWQRRDISVYSSLHTALHMVQCAGNRVLFSRSVFLLIRRALHMVQC